MIEIDTHRKEARSWDKTALGYARQEAFKPTSCAVESGRIWIADGYGSHLVHCLDEQGALSFSLDGSSGAGRFDCPHTVFIDTRKGRHEVLIADRGNHRIQRFSTQGDFLGLIEIPGLITPSAFAILGVNLLVVELEARLHVLDGNNALVTTHFDGRDLVAKGGWPNRLYDGVLRAPDDLIAGKLNSPHSICVDHAQNIYISEWLIGDRFIKLEKVDL